MSSDGLLFKSTTCPSFFQNSHDVMDPWPSNCKVYKTSNACNKY